MSVFKKMKFYIFILCLFGLYVFAECKSDPSQTKLSESIVNIRIPSLNGNLISVKIYKPDSKGPYPVLIGINGGDESHVFSNYMYRHNDLIRMGVMLVDFAPQGRSISEGKDDHNGYVHQDDLKAIIDFLVTQSFVDKNNIGIFSFSFGLVLVTGTLFRYPDLPVQFLIDMEGPYCPGKQVRMGRKNNESWVNRPNVKRLVVDNVIHGGNIYDDKFWKKRDALVYIKKIPCPYLRIQFDNDHALGNYGKFVMARIINTATKYSGQWTRCNKNPSNIIYKESELGKYRFLTGIPYEIITLYIKEMFFKKPWLEK